MSDQERGEKVNKLSKICGRTGVLPQAMRIRSLPEGSEEPECFGGFASIFKHMHNGIRVAVKVINTYATSDTDNVFRVSFVPMSTDLYSPTWRC